MSIVWSDAAVIEAIRQWTIRNSGKPPTYEAWRRASSDHPSASAVHARIGWNEAIARAGFEPIKWRRTWSDAQIVDAIRTWAARNAGVPPTCADWQSSTGDHPAASTIRNGIGWNEALSRAGFTPRKRHGGPGPGVRPKRRAGPGAP